MTCALPFALMMTHASEYQVTNETLVTIFRTILSWHLEIGGFPASCKQLGPAIISATLDMYSQSMAKLLPTPTKSHYTFNLRDFARVIQVLSYSGTDSHLFCLHIQLAGLAASEVHAIQLGVPTGKIASLLAFAC